MDLFNLQKSSYLRRLLVDVIFHYGMWFFTLLIFDQDAFRLALFPMLINITMNYIEGDYEINPIWQRYSQRKLASRIFINLVVTFILTKYLVMFFHQSFFIRARLYFVAVLPLHALLYYFYRKLLAAFKNKFLSSHRILLIGSVNQADLLNNWLANHHLDRSYHIEKIIDLNLSEQFISDNTHPVAYNKRDCFGDLSQYDSIVYFEDQKFDTIETRKLLRASTRNKSVLSFVHFCGHLEPTYPIEHVSAAWILNNTSNLWIKVQIYLRFRVVFDFLVSIIVLTLLSPMLILVAFCIALDSRGPIFYVQERVGKLGQKFKLYKFRTMVVESEVDGPQFTRSNDPRITKVGSFLRSTRIDEIPQFINILKGEMALIGPRPEREHFENLLKEQISLLQLRNLIKPGITGLAQTRADYANDLESYKRKLGYDIYYIKNISPVFDLAIILQTIRTVFSRKGQ